MGRSRTLERFLHEDIDAALKYYTGEFALDRSPGRVNKHKILRYFNVYKEYQENWELPAIEDSTPAVTLQCLYRIESMMITFINLRNMGRL